MYTYKELMYALRRAPIQSGVLQCKNVNSAFVTRSTQEGRVMAEVDAVKQCEIEPFDTTNQHLILP